MLLKRMKNYVREEVAVPDAQLGTAFTNKFFPACARAAGKFSVFGELLSQPSRLAPNAAVDCSVGQLVAAGLATTATLLCASLLRSATRCAAAASHFLRCPSFHI